MIEYANLCIIIQKYAENKEKTSLLCEVLCIKFGDPYGIRTHVTTVRGWCLNRLTNGPYEILVTRAGAFANAQRKSKIFRTLRQ